MRGNRGALGTLARLLLPLAVPLMVHACTGETVTEVSVSEVEVSPSAVSAVVGESVRLSAVVRDELGEELSSVSLLWSSDDPSVAEVDASGLVHARSSGRVLVRATYEGVSGTSNVRVFAGPGIETSMDSVALLAAVGRPSPEPQVVHVTNEGTGTLGGLTAQARHTDGDPAWLTAALDGSTAPASVTLTADSDELPAGVYAASLAIASSTSDVTPFEIPVTLRVAGVVVQATGGGTVVSESGSADSLLVVLGSSPVSDVVLRVTSGDVGEATVSPARLTFTPSTWETSQAISVVGVDDSTTDGDQATTVTVSVDDGASDPAYDLVADLTARVTTSDDDVAGLNVSESGGSTVVTEGGGSDGISVVLTAQPATDVELEVTSADPTEVTASPGRLTFTQGNWSAAQTVTVRGVDDAATDGDQVTSVTISVDAGASDGAFDAVEDQTVNVTTTDDDQGGFSVSESGGSTRVDETGATDDLGVVLTAEPSSSVVLDVTSSDPLEAVVSPGRLTFTPGNWSSLQAVTVRGVDDPSIDGEQTTTVTVAVDPAASDDAFDAVPDRTVTVTTSDDDAAALSVVESGGGTVVDEAGGTDDIRVALAAAPAADVVVDVTSADLAEATVAPTRLTFTSANWSVAQTVTVTGVDDPVTDGDQTTTITVSVDAAASDDAFDGAPDATVAVTITDDDQGGLAVSETAGSTVVSEAGGTDGFLVSLTAVPAADVVLDVTSGDPGEATVSPTRLTFTQASWSAAQTVTVTGVDDAVTDGDQATTVTVAVDPTASDDAYDGVADQTVGVTTTDDDAGGVTVSETGASTVVSEAGGTDELSVALAAQPISDVVVDVTTADPGEVTAFPTRLTFTAAGWSTPQTVTLSGVDDPALDGDQTTVVTVSVDVAASDDAFDAVAPLGVSVTTLDDDVAGIVVVESGGSTEMSEGGTDTFTVALTAAPLTSVVLAVSSADVSVATVFPGVLTFAPTDWSVPQTVTTTGTDDLVVDGAQVTTVTIGVVAAVSNAAYDAVADATVSVTTHDDDGGGAGAASAGG